MGKLLDVLIRRLRLLRIDHMDVVVIQNFRFMALYPVGVEHHDHLTARRALIVAQNILQQAAGAVHVPLCQLPKLLPGKNDVVAVHQKIPVPALGRPGGGLSVASVHPAAGMITVPAVFSGNRFVPFVGSIGAGEDLVDFLRSHPGFFPFSVVFPGNDLTGTAVLSSRAVRRISVPGSPGQSGRGTQIVLIESLFLRLLSHPGKRKVHIVRHPVPGHHKAGTVGAEYGIRRVVRIPGRIISGALHHLRRIVAGLIALQGDEKPAVSPAVGGHLFLVVLHFRSGDAPRQNGRLPVVFRCSECAVHPLDVRHGPADQAGRNLQPKIIPGLQQHAVRLHQSLPHRPVGGLPEVSSLRMLQMGAAGKQGDLQIRDGRSRQHAGMLPFLQMGQHQPLPVPVQFILAAGGSHRQPAARLSRLQQQMHLRIMPQRLKMPHTLHRIRNRFLVYNISGSEGYLHAEAFPDQVL